MDFHPFYFDFLWSGKNFNYPWLPIMDLTEDDAGEIKLSPAETDRELSL